MTLRVTGILRDQVLRAAEAAYPEEACGLLLGRVPDAFEKPGRLLEVDEARALSNGWETGPRTNRYALDPKALADLERSLSGSGRAVVGVYHSHPDAPAWPSPFDLERAWPCYSYWIVSVRAGNAAGSRSWVRSEDGENFIEEPILPRSQETRP